MGKIYSPPKDIGNPPSFRDYLIDGRYDSKGMQKAEEEWEEKLRTWCKKNSNDDLAGEIVKEPVADGQAMYMVFTTKPVKLIHLPFGDAYEFQWAHRWTGSDIKSMVMRERQIKALLAGK